MQNKIKTIKIENFRRFNHSEINFKDGNYFALAGRNGTGKTSILEAINIAFSQRSSKYTEVKESDFYSDDPIKFTLELFEPFFLSFEDTINIRTNGYREQKIERLIPCKSFSKTISKRTTKERNKLFSSEYDISINFKFDEKHTLDDAGNSRLRKHFNLRKNQIIIRGIKNIGEGKFDFCTKADGKTWSTKTDFLGFRYMPRVMFPETFYFDNKREKELLKEYNTTFANVIEELSWRYKRELTKEDNLENILKESQNINTLIKKINPYDDKLLEETKNVLKNDFKSLEENYCNPEFLFIDPYHPYSDSLLGHTTPTNRTVSSLSYGSGISTLIALVMSVSFASKTSGPAIILIDEPELHLQANLQKELFEFLRNSSFQSIVATHSPHFINKESCSANLILEEVEGGISLSYGTEMKVTDLHFRLLGDSPDDLLVPERVLIVEGQYDKSIILRCLELLGKEDKKIQTVIAGGKDRIPNKPKEYEKVIKIFLKKAEWYSDYIKKCLKIIVDSDVPESKLDGWEGTFGLNKTSQLKRLNKKGIEYLFPETLVKDLTVEANTKLIDGTFLKNKDSEEIVETILNDNEKAEAEKKQTENRISKQRLNEYINKKLTGDILESNEGVQLRELVDWICEDTS